MAFQSNTLINGEWTTRTVDVDTVLRHYNEQDKANTAAQGEIEKTPKFGLLTQTVIRSPLAHFILPVKLRDSKLHDVAFVGVREMCSLASWSLLDLTLLNLFYLNNFQFLLW